MGFEPTRAEPNGLAVHRLNHSATSSPMNLIQEYQSKYVLKKLFRKIVSRNNMDNFSGQIKST